MEDKILEKSYLEINLSAIKNNIQKIKKKVGEGVTVAPVIKANAYGLGTSGLKEVFDEENIKIVAVATLYEAVKLRNEGYKQDILTLNELLPNEVEVLVKYDLTCGLSDLEVAIELNKVANKANKVAKVHVEVDTGMGRVGRSPGEMLKFVIQVSKLSNLQIEGIYTHFSSADSSPEYTNLQVEKFDKVLDELQNNGFSFKYIHASASSGIMNVKDSRFNMARPGIITYGYMPDKDMENVLGVIPATKLLSHVVFVKEVPKGTAIGYGRTYITEDKRKIATIPIGYADGVRRSLSNRGRVYINGKYAPIVGRVCMDNLMVDVTGIDVKTGDEVAIWDNEHITVEEIADLCDTVNYEILCGISARVKRIYID